MNYFDDKRIQDNDKITTYPYGYFENDVNINNEIKNNTDKLNEIDNSGIIPKNYNTKGSLKNTNITLDVNKIVYVNNDIYADSAKSACIDIIKSTTIYADLAKSTCNDIIKSTTIYVDSAKSTCNDIIKCTNVKINKKNTNITRVYCKNINNKSAHSKINYELNALLKLKKVSDNNIIIKKKLNPQVINVKYELNALY